MVSRDPCTFSKERLLPISGFTDGSLPGQPKSENLYFGPGNDDGRLVAILVPPEMVRMARGYASQYGVNPDLIREYNEWFDSLGE